MTKGITPACLSSLVPDTVGNSTNYNLRRANDLQGIACRTSMYKNSFIPSVVEGRNALPDDIRNLDSLAAFKTYLDRDQPIHVPNKLYFIGEREYQIIHTRLRNKCSSLNFDLFQKNLVASRLCQCGGIESSHHYLLEYGYYTIVRNKLFATIENFTTVSLDVLLYGDEILSFQENVTVFLEVQSFIKDSKRFKL